MNIAMQGSREGDSDAWYHQLEQRVLKEEEEADGN